MRIFDCSDDSDGMGCHEQPGDSSIPSKKPRKIIVLSNLEEEGAIISTANNMLMKMHRYKCYKKYKHYKH